jgi:predicted negative regulator of RcsB-dependent stress response
VAYDLEEQEQIDTFKAFWERWGNLLMTVVTVVLLAFAAYRAWGWYQDNRSAQAALAYEQLRGAANAKDLAKVKETAGVVFEQFSGTVYGPMAALIAAKAYAEGDDLKGSKAALQWVIDKSKDDEFRQVARVRLAGVLLDEKLYDDALKQVTGVDSGRYAAAFADRRGDILLAQGKRDEAKAAFKMAFEKYEGTSPMKRLVQIKLDGLDAAGS